jgi:hypothetical protein
MSESTFPFGEPVEAPLLEESEPKDSRKAVFAVAGVVASLVLGAGAFLVLGGGDDDVELGGPPPAPSAAAPVEAEPAPVEVVPVATTEQLGRSPFKVLYTEPKAASAGTTTEGDPSGTGSGATSGPVDAGTASAGGGTGEALPGTTTTTGATGGSTGGSLPDEQPTAPPKFVKVDVVDADANQVAFALVDRTAERPEDRNQTVIVKPGEVFATYFKLLGYGTLKDAGGNDRKCTDLQYGDARLKLCEGESYQVG